VVKVKNGGVATEIVQVLVRLTEKLANSIWMHPNAKWMVYPRGFLRPRSMLGEDALPGPKDAATAEGPLSAGVRSLPGRPLQPAPVRRHPVKGTVCRRERSTAVRFQDERRKSMLSLSAEV
jgi:hypothetical protein